MVDIKGKILMLHGFVQSDTIFSAKTGGLRKSLKKIGYEAYYPCGPMLVDKSTLLGGDSHREKQDVASEFNTTNDSSADLYGWWIKTSSGPKGLLEYKIEESTFRYLRSYIIENGPFDGVIGFSQGAGFGGFLVNNFNELLNLTKEQQPDLKFFISFSGFRLEPKEYQHHYDNNKNFIPSLHIKGELDAVVSEERVNRLYETWPEDKRSILVHPGSHFVPNSKPFVSQVCNWIQAVTRVEKEHNKNGDSKEEIEVAKPTDKPDIDDDLMSMIDSIGKL